MEKSNLKYAKKLFNIIGGANPQEMMDAADGVDIDAGAAAAGGTDGATAMDAIKNNTGEILLPWNQTRYENFEKLFEEPCFTSGGIQSSKKKAGVASTGFQGVFWKGAFSIFELPIFGWSQKSGIDHGAFSPVTKFLYCFFVKICGWPLYMSYIGLRFIYMMLKAFLRTIILVLAGIINTFATIIIGFPPISLPWEKKNLDGSGGKIWRPQVWESFTAIFGLTIPFQSMNRYMGDNYGKGEIGIFVIIVMTISAILITITGLNIVVIGGTFVYFLYKSLVSLKEKAQGIDIREGGSTGSGESE